MMKAFFGLGTQSGSLFLCLRICWEEDSKEDLLEELGDKSKRVSVESN